MLSFSLLFSFEIKFESIREGINSKLLSFECLSKLFLFILIIFYILNNYLIKKYNLFKYN